MTKKHTQQTAIVLFTLFIGVSIIAAGGASAQQVEGGAENETGTDEPAQLYDQLLDLNIIDVRFVEEEGDGHVLYATMEWTGRAPESITLTQINRDAGRVAIEQRRLLPNEQVEVRLDLINDDPVMLLSEQGINRQQGVVLSKEVNEATDTTLLRGTLIGIAVSLTAVVAMAWRHYNVDESPQEGWEE